MKKLLTISLLTIFLISCGGKSNEVKKIKAKTEKELDRQISKIIMLKAKKEGKPINPFKGTDFNSFNKGMALAFQLQDPIKEKENLLKDIQHDLEWVKKEKNMGEKYKKLYRKQREEKKIKFFKEYPDKLRKKLKLLEEQKQNELKMSEKYLRENQVDNFFSNQKYEYITKRYDSKKAIYKKELDNLKGGIKWKN